MVDRLELLRLVTAYAVFLFLLLAFVVGSRRVSVGAVEEAVAGFWDLALKLARSADMMSTTGAVVLLSFLTSIVPPAILVSSICLKLVWK